MAIAEIITIGTELLLGEIQDTNSKYIARVLRDIGVDIYRLTTVGDNQNRITATIQEALTRADIVITTGGLGPTVDDPTRQAVAVAFEIGLIYQETLWEQIQKRFERYNRIPTENNKRQAYIPEGAIVIENPVGTAPAFAVEYNDKSIISLPGVPREMEYLMDHFVLNYLKKRYGLEETIIKARVIHTASLGESSIDEIIGELETLNNPTVGLLAHPGQTDIRITAKANSVHDADEMIAPIEAIIFKKLDKYIFGVDNETLDQAVAKLLQENNFGVAIIECGLGNSILAKLKALAPEHISGEWLDGQLSVGTTKKLMEEYAQKDHIKIALGLRLTPGEKTQELFMSLYTNGKFTDQFRSYDGPTGNASEWATTLGLDTIRRKILEM